MKHKELFLTITVWGILGVAWASWAQSGSPYHESLGVAYGREAGNAAVKLHGPDLLTGLVEQAIREKRPNVAVEIHYEPLQNKVRIEGTTGSGTVPLSPKRVELMQAARREGRSVYAALCSEQKGVIERTVGMKSVPRHVEREAHRIEETVCFSYVQPICPLPPPQVLCALPVGVFIGVPPLYVGHGIHGRWRIAYHPYLRGARAYRALHRGDGIRSPQGRHHGSHR